MIAAVWIRRPSFPDVPEYVEMNKDRVSHILSESVEFDGGYPG